MNVNAMGIAELRLAVQELRRYPADVERLEDIIRHHRPLLCGRCGDAIHGTGNVCGCGRSLCECGDDAVLTADTTEKRAIVYEVTLPHPRKTITMKGKR